MDPLNVPEFFSAFFSAAAVIVAGACYALSLAWARLRGGRVAFWMAGLSYAVLLGSTLILRRALHLEGLWDLLLGVMLLGYLFAPPLVFRLCLATHADGSHASSTALQSQDATP